MKWEKSLLRVYIKRKQTDMCSHCCAICCEPHIALGHATFCPDTDREKKSKIPTVLWGLRVKNKKKHIYNCLLKSLLFVTMFSFIYLHSYAYLESITILCSEHWDWGSRTTTGCSSLQPYYGIYRAVLFIRTLTPHQKRKNSMLVSSTKEVPNPKSQLACQQPVAGQKWS